MKSIVISMTIVGLLTCAAQAEETSGPTYSGSATRIVNVANQITEQGIVTHQHDYTDKDSYATADKQKHQAFTYGGGADVDRAAGVVLPGS